MAKSTRKTFTVQRRFDVWVSQDITAASFDDAVTAAKAMEFDDFLETTEGTGIVDFNVLPGLNVGESF